MNSRLPQQNSSGTLWNVITSLFKPPSISQTNEGGFVTLALCRCHCWWVDRTSSQLAAVFLSFPKDPNISLPYSGGSTQSWTPLITGRKYPVPRCSLICQKGSTQTNGWQIKPDKFTREIRHRFCTVWVINRWPKLPTAVVDSPWKSAHLKLTKGNMLYTAFKKHVELSATRGQEFSEI